MESEVGAAAVPQQRTDEPADIPAVTGPGLRLELLVHGVGGTTPQAMLEDPHLAQLTGDAVAGTYRRWEDRNAEATPERYRGDAVQEAYSWANLTSGAATRALWLLLLPFMLANLVHWMRPASARAARGYEALVRLIAVSLTALLVGAAVEAAMDLTAWQCASTAACSAQHSWLVFFLGGHGGWLGTPGRRLAVAALAPVALVALLWWLSRLTWSAYESQTPGAPGVDSGEPMEQQGFWYGMRMVRRLRRVHVGVGLLTVDVALLLPLWQHDRGWLGAAGWALLLAVAALAVLLVAQLVPMRRIQHRVDIDPDGPLLSSLPRACMAVLGLSLLYALAPRPGWIPGGHLPGATTLLSALTAAQFALVALLAWTTRGLLRAGSGTVSVELRQLFQVRQWVTGAPCPYTVPGPGTGPQADETFGGPDGPALRGYAGVATALLAVGLGGLLSAGLTVWWAQRLAGHGQAPVPPPVMVWHGSGVPVVALAVVVVALLRALQLAGQKRAFARQVARAYPGATEGGPRTGAIAGALAKATLTDYGPVLIGTLGVLAGVVGVASLAGGLLSGETPVRAAGVDGVVGHTASALQNLGGWLVAATVVGLVALGRAAYRNLATRKTVGIVWDIGTFWPRAAHPFAPPCYAERAVPDLVWRTRTWLRQDPERRLVLSAHSQGTVLAAAAVWQLDPETRQRTALLTYGSPLRRLYGRFFPAYFGPEDLLRLRKDAPHWHNLFRVTDPIGGPVRVPATGAKHAPDWPALTDPLAWGRDAEHPLPVPVHAHSDYQADPQFTVARDRLLSDLGRDQANDPNPTAP